MSQYYGDRQKKCYKIYRDHDSRFVREFRNHEMGFCVTNQSDYGLYTDESPGDEINWCYWPPRQAVGKKPGLKATFTESV